MAVELVFNAKFDDLFSGMRQTEAGMETLQQTSNETNKVISDGAKKATTEQSNFNKALKDTATTSQATVGTATKVADSFGKLAIQQTQVIAKQKQLEAELAKTIALGAQAAQTYGINSAEAQKYAQQINNITNEIKEMNPQVDDAADSMETLRQQIKQAENAAIEFQRQADKGLISQKVANDAIRHAAELKDEFTDFKARLDAFNPDRKFAIVSQLAQGIAGGFAAAQGAMALFGAESEDVQKALLKVQGALALSQGINSVLEMKDTFKSLSAILGITTVATEAQAAANVAQGTTATGAAAATRGLTAALAANPFTAAAIAILAIVSALVLLADEAKVAGENYTDLAESIKNAGDLTEAGFNEQAELRQKDIELMEAHGKTEKQITDAKIADINRLISAQKVLIQFDQERVDQADITRGLQSASAETRAQAEKDFIEASKSLAERTKQVELYRQDLKIINAKFNQDEVEQEKNKNAEILKERKKLEEDLLALRKNFLDLTTQIEYDSFTEREKILFDFNKKLSELESAFSLIPNPDLNDKTRLEKAVSDLNDQLKKALEEFMIQKAPEIEIPGVELKTTESFVIKNAPDFVERLNQELKNAAKGKGFSIANVLFPNNPDEDRKLIDQKLQEIGQSIQSAVNSIFELQQQEIDQRQNANELFLSDLEERINATEAALNKELDLQKKGYANNVSAKQAELAKLKEEERKALEEKKRIAEEEKKLSREKAIAASLEAGAQMTLAVAELFVKGALSGPAGVISAIALSAAILAQFLALKAQLSQTSLEEGGEIDFGLVKGNRHSQGGGERIGRTNIFVEGGEFVSRRSVAQDYGNLLHDLNKGRTSQQGNDELAQLLAERGIVMSGSEIKKYSQSKGDLKAIEIGRNVESEKETKKLRGEFGEFTKKHFDKDEVVINSDGSKSVTKGAITTIYK